MSKNFTRFFIFLTVVELCTFPHKLFVFAQAPAVDPQQFLYRFEIDRAAGEKYMPEDTFESEQKEYQKLIDLFTAHFRSKYSLSEARQSQKDQGETGYALRGVHAKGHGCLAGTFAVEDHGRPEFQFGIFSTPKKYQIAIRVSNGDGPPESDSNRTISIGLAFKVLGVELDKLLPAQNEDSADFLMTNHPNFIVGNIQNFAQVIDGRENGLTAKAKAFLVARSGLAQRLMVSKNDPLATPYWGNLPFKIGDTVVKYVLRAERCAEKASAGEVKVTSKMRKDPDFLGKVLAEHIQNNSACYGFYFVKRAGERESPVEDASVSWPEDDKLVARVATLTIPVQDPNESLLSLNLPQAKGLSGKQVCQHLAFSPWNTTNDFKPLSSLNRARRVIYELSTAMRRNLNNAINPAEPKK